jgi:hypothetical protein
LKGEIFCETDIKDVNDNRTHFSKVFSRLKYEMNKLRVLSFCLLIAIATCADLNWWKGGNFYQIYPRSFMDSDGDGIGDLQGIKSKVAYLKEIGMDGVWLSPIMKSPQYDFGYDISDYRDIQKEYGTLKDLDELVAECNKYGIKLILDFVPNHSSHLHEWFKKSVDREPGYENYYVWHPGTFDPITGKRIRKIKIQQSFKFLNNFLFFHSTNKLG